MGSTVEECLEGALGLAPNLKSLVICLVDPREDSSMGVQVDVFTWPEITVSPGAQVDLVHWIVDSDGASMIDPDHWCWMSTVPEFAGVRPDRPVPAAAIRIVAQGAVRDRVDEPGLNNTNWFVTWFNPGDVTTTFTPRMAMAPAR